MQKKFQTYFPDLNALDSNSIRSSSSDLSDGLLNFLNNSTARNAFEALVLPKFLSKMSKQYPYVAGVPVRVLLMFLSTYLCEQGFSTMFSMKITFRAQLCLKGDRVSLSKTVNKTCITKLSVECCFVYNSM